MRDLDREPQLDLSARPIDKVTGWLDQRTHYESVVLVIASAVVVICLDFRASPNDLRLGTLYLFPISLACWQFRSRSAVSVTVVLTLTAFLRYVWLEEASLEISVANGVMRAIGFGLLTIIVLGFRRKFDEIAIIASRDSMTGVLNKLAFQERAQIMFEQAKSLGGVILIIYFDLDGFKSVNDRNGHNAGDNVLRRVAAGAAKRLRQGDCLGRLGGDEFAIATLISSVQVPQQFAESLHQCVSLALKETGLTVTCSMGAISVLPAEGLELVDLVNAADELMYEVKNSGKNACRFRSWHASTLDVCPTSATG